MKIISSKITEALEFCAIAHMGQTRKASKTPFASHPSSVGFILQSAGYSEEVIIAGILHDVIEDTPYTEENLEKLFGSRVAELVKGVTEDITIKSWIDKKNDYLSKVKIGENDIKAISAADLLDNCRAMIRSLNNGINIWNSFNVTPKAIMTYHQKRFSVLEKHIKPNLKKNLKTILKELTEKMPNSL